VVQAGQAVSVAGGVVLLAGGVPLTDGLLPAGGVVLRWLGGLGSVDRRCPADAVPALPAEDSSDADASSPVSRLVTFDWAWVTTGWSARLRAPSTICW
jgi:hypothetical protein